MRTPNHNTGVSAVSGAPLPSRYGPEKHRTVVRLDPSDPSSDYHSTTFRASPSQRRRDCSPLSGGDTLADDLYKSRSFDEDYAQQVTSNPKRSTSHGRRSHEPKLPISNLVVANEPKVHLSKRSGGGGGGYEGGYRNRSPMIMEPASPMDVEDRREEEGELNENDQFYHLKKMLSNANLQNNRNYQLSSSSSKSRSDRADHYGKTQHPVMQQVPPTVFREQSGRKSSGRAVPMNPNADPSVGRY